MKIPKTVNICGMQYKVRTDKKEGGGSFDGKIPGMLVGTLYPHDVTNIFLHEVLEAICAERAVRFKSHESHSNYLFVMNHKEFEDVVRDLATALSPLLK